MARATRALRTVPAAVESTESIDAFIASNALSKNSSGEAWRRWPAEMITEIDRIVAHNDANQDARVKYDALVKRAKERFNVLLSRSALDHFLKTQRGRSGWAKA